MVQQAVILPENFFYQDSLQIKDSKLAVVEFFSQNNFNYIIK